MTDVQTDAPAVKRPPASIKSFLDLAGADVGELGPTAKKLKYVSLKDGKPSKETIIDVAGMGPAEILMLALMGATTLATNTASFNRNSAKAEDAFPDDVDAVNDRFARITSEDWGNKGGGGFAIDLDALAQAAEKAAGRSIPDVAAWKAKMETEPVTKKNLRNHKDIAPLYDEIVREKRNAGKPEVPLNEGVLGF